MLDEPLKESELILGLIGAVGTELPRVRDILEERLKASNYQVTHIRITRDVIPRIVEPEETGTNDEYKRIISLMNAGDEAREQSGDNSILALGAAAYINSQRGEKQNGRQQPQPRHAFIISSLKHPDEVARLREIYPLGFYLIGVQSDEKRRRKWLEEDKRIHDRNHVEELIKRDENGQLEHGQRVADTFHLSDFFVRIDDEDWHLKRSLWRILALLFGHPYVTPTFDEHAMFMAFAASLHSADLARQVGAVVAAKEQVLAVGANDVPKAGGGQYWAVVDKLPEDSQFPEDGRDFARGCDANKIEQQRIIDEILQLGEKEGLDKEALGKALEESRIRDLTEFGRVVHAEMDALLACARAGISTQNTTLYATTFPCHNCAKHIISAGISRVVFIEPYPKSKAPEFHEDSIQVSLGNDEGPQDHIARMRFEPFVGVGPRRYFDLFSAHLSSGYHLKRRGANGRKLEWSPESGRLRLRMLPASYVDLELLASDMFNTARLGKEKSDAE